MQRVFMLVACLSFATSNATMTEATTIAASTDVSTLSSFLPGRIAIPDEDLVVATTYTSVYSQDLSSYVSRTHAVQTKITALPPTLYNLHGNVPSYLLRQWSKDYFLDQVLGVKYTTSLLKRHDLQLESLLESIYLLKDGMIARATFDTRLNNMKKPRQKQLTRKRIYLKKTKDAINALVAAIDAIPVTHVGALPLHFSYIYA